MGLVTTYFSKKRGIAIAVVTTGKFFWWCDLPYYGEGIAAEDWIRLDCEGDWFYQSCLSVSGTCVYASATTAEEIGSGS